MSEQWSELISHEKLLSDFPHLPWKDEEAGVGLTVTRTTFGPLRDLVEAPLAALLGGCLWGNASTLA